MKLADLDLNLLVAFDAIATERNVTRAAARLGVGQSSLSRSLARLRDALDDPLFVKVHGGVQPTPLAESLAPRIRALLGELEATLGQARGFDPASDAAQLVVSTNDYCELVLFVELVGRLSREAPGVRLHLRRRGLSGLESDVDLAVGTFLDGRPNLRRRLLWHESFATAVRVGHPALEADALPLDAFCDLPHVLVADPGDGPGVVDYALAGIGRERRVAVTVPDYLVALRMAAASDHVVTLPRRLLHTAGHWLDLVTVEPPLELPGFPVHAWWHERLHADPLHRWLREHLLPA